jgi:hypothetical protein
VKICNLSCYEENELLLLAYLEKIKFKTSHDSIFSLWGVHPTIPREVQSVGCSYFVRVITYDLSGGVDGFVSKK